MKWHALNIVAIVTAMAGCAKSEPAPNTAITAAPPAATSATPSLIGRYEHKHDETLSKDGEERQMIIIDIMRITDGGAGRLEVDASFTDVSGSQCSFAGDFTPDPTAHQTWKFASPTSDQTDTAADFCQVTLEFRTESVVIASTGGCSDYCGNQAYIDGTFDYPPTSADPGEPIHDDNADEF